MAAFSQMNSLLLSQSSVRHRRSLNAIYTHSTSEGMKIIIITWWR